MLSLQGREFLINLHTLALYIKETLQGLLEESACSCDLAATSSSSSSSPSSSSSYTSSSDLAASSWPGSESSFSTSGARSNSAPFVPASFSDFLP